MTAFKLAQRFVGQIQEFPGAAQHPFIQWSHMLCGLGIDQPDEVPWCSSWANAICWLLRLPRSKSAAARSWLLVGQPIGITVGMPENDVVILKRAGSLAGPDVTSGAPGHVGFFAGYDHVLGVIHVLGGNQSNAVTVQAFPKDLLLGVRRLK